MPESRSFPPPRRETQRVTLLPPHPGPKSLNYIHIFNAVLCIFWQDLGSGTTQNLKNGLGHNSVVSSRGQSQCFFLPLRVKTHTPPTAASAHFMPAVRDESSRSHYITLQLDVSSSIPRFQESLWSVFLPAFIRTG